MHRAITELPAGRSPRRNRLGVGVLTEGVSEREVGARVAVGLDTHVRDAVNVLVYEDLGGVVLVGR